MKLLFVLEQLGAAVVHKQSRRKMLFVNCVVFATDLFTTLIENLRVCSFAKAGIVLKF